MSNTFSKTFQKQLKIYLRPKDEVRTYNSFQAVDCFCVLTLTCYKLLETCLLTMCLCTYAIMLALNI